MSTIVKFPLAGPMGVIAADLEVTRLSQLDGRQRNVRAPELPRGTATLVESARDMEPASQRKLQGIAVRVKGVPQQPTGRSFGLALALADKVTRYGMAAAFEGREIWATGNIKSGSTGDVEPVEQFTEKFKFIIQAAKLAPITFYYPIEHQDEIDRLFDYDPDILGGVDLDLMPVSEVAGAEALWARKVMDVTEALNEVRKRKLWPLVASVAGLVAVVAIVSAVMLNRPAEHVLACEKASVPLNLVSPKEEAIKKAQLLCTEAVDKSPRNARLHFLLGQAFAVSGDTLQARQAWQKAADLGNADGLAAVAYTNWITSPSDKSEVIKAIQMLETAAEQGAEDAPNLLATIFMDGRALPPDPIMAEYWIKKANEQDN